MRQQQEQLQRQQERERERERLHELQQLQQQGREREQLRELNWPSPAAEAECRAGLGPGIPVGGWVAAPQAVVARAWAATREAGTSQSQTRAQTQER